ncbi:hypothetical protein Tco_1141835 [Tanacetum coccineum]
MFRIDPRKTSREDKFVPINKIKASVRTNPITISQPQVITKKDVNSDSNGLSSIRVENTAKTRRPQPKSNTKNDRVLSASKSSCFKNKEFEVEERHRNLLLSKNKKHMSFECNNVKLAIWNDKSEVVIQIGLWCVDSGCLKHMAGNLKLLINFVWKFLGTIRFRNDHVAAILGYNDLQWGNILITWVYFIEGLGHNLFSVGQFCNSDLENDSKDIRKLGTKGLDLTYVPSTITTQQPTEHELDLLFKAMYDDYIGGQPSAATRTVLAA